MRAFSAVIVALLFMTLLMGGGETPTSATSAIQQSFSSKYGSELVNRYSCELCHPPGAFSQFNSYGEDLLAALEEVGECQEFFPPNTHTVAFGRCDYLHMEGYTDPLKNCSLCHGVDLNGLIAPSCFLCHGVRWAAGSPATPGKATHQVMNSETAFEAIETLDSDGDGFDNITEINAGSHPGDADIFPGGAELEVDMKDKWKRSWSNVRGEIKLELTPGGGYELTEKSVVYLLTDDGKLYASNQELKGSTLVVYIPKALIYSIIDNPNADKVEVTIVAETAEGEKLMAVKEITLYGDAQTLLEGVSFSINPKTWEDGEDITFIITDAKALVNAEKPITIFGPAKSIVSRDGVRAGKRIKIEVKYNDAISLIGDAMEDVPYTLSVSGYGVARKTFLALNRTVKVVTEGGGDECYDFDPPGTHTEARTQGDCTYMHAPGLATPYANACNACHGSDLKGSAFAPSCLLCHGQYWADPTPITPVRKEAK